MRNAAGRGTKRQGQGIQRMQSTASNHEARSLPDRKDAGRIFILADDLTGACDSGAAFLAAGRSVRVVLDAACLDAARLRQMEVDCCETVWVFTTETRNLSSEEASEVVAASMAALHPVSQDALFFKKIDSAARGHLGVEIMAALRQSRVALALVAPAFPGAARTVQSGILNVRDWSGQDAMISLRDLFPDADANAVDVLPAGSEQQLEQGIMRAVANGTRILLCDSNTQADLEHLAAAAVRVEQPLLWAGSAGLAHALAGTLPAAHATTVFPGAHRDGRTLLFVGTRHPVTNLQVSHLEQDSGATDRTIHRIQRGTTSEQEVVAAFVAQPVSALVLTGGGTAAFVLHALGASSIVLAGELALGIPWGFIEGGLADGCIVITKSGGFGEHDALVHAFEFCEGRSL
jgi:D-threonate/D-erythronate kinase